MAKIKLVSLNIEGDNHLRRVAALLQNERPGVACLQEVYAADLGFLEKVSGMKAVFAPMTVFETAPRNTPSRLSGRGKFGVAVLTRETPLRVHEKYYLGSRDSIPSFPDTEPYPINRVLLGLDVAHPEDPVTVLTTHFTWSAGGRASRQQRVDLKKMFAVLDGIGEFALAGDFNAPRGGEIFNRLAKRYQDNIPPEVTSTIDPQFHYAKDKDLRLVVDGLFTTPGVRATGVKTTSGVSDHKAITAAILPRPASGAAGSPSYS